MLTPRTLRAARALLGWSREKLAEKSGTAIETIQWFEARGSDPKLSTLNSWRRALELGGVMFIDVEAGDPFGPGVRIRSVEQLERDARRERKESAERIRKLVEGKRQAKKPERKAERMTERGDWTIAMDTADRDALTQAIDYALDVIEARSKTDAPHDQAQAHYRVLHNFFEVIAQESLALPLVSTPENGGRRCGWNQNCNSSRPGSASLWKRLMSTRPSVVCWQSNSKRWQKSHGSPDAVAAVMVGDQETGEEVRVRARDASAAVSSLGKVAR